MNEELRRSIILENYETPSNWGNPGSEEYIHKNTSNESCIDNIDLFIKLNNDVVEDIKFIGEACAICVSTTSIMTKLLIGKTKNEAKQIIGNYFNMIEEKEYNPEVLKEATAYCETYKQPSRKKCATLTWIGINDVIETM